MNSETTDHWLYQPAGGSGCVLAERRNPPPPPPEAGRTAAGIDLAALHTFLGKAAEHGRIERPAPRLHWLPRFARPVGRKVAREAARLVRRTSPRQERFNGAVLGVLQATLNLLSAHWGNRLEEMEVDLADLRDRVEAAEADVRRINHEARYDLADLRAAIRTQEDRLSQFLVRAGGQPSGPPSPSPAAETERGSIGDRDYVRFEDQFRGPREQIRRRLAVYLDAVGEAEAGTPGRPVLDLGPGRGEWLELLRERGWPATGVDQNLAMVHECRARGLAVVEAEALAYLRALPADSLGAVTAFHVVEHISSALLPTFLAEIVRVLAPGGVTILETPNPENLVTAACDFYRDPTHVRPLHPETLQFLAERHGLVRVRVVRLTEDRGPDPPELVPWHHPLAEHLNPLIEMARRRLFVAPDYAVIGYKPDRAALH